MPSLLQACVTLGLEPATGFSPFICVLKLENITGKRLTGNGSTIRRDQKPWLFFAMENVKQSNKIVGYKFNGYQTVHDEKVKLQSQLLQTQKRAKAEAAKVTSRLAEMDDLTNKRQKYLYTQADAF